MNTRIFLSAVLLILTSAIPAQPGNSLAERLGYPVNSKLLIIHADDMGLAHSVNKASLQAYRNGSITSGSIMVPCPWANEMISALRAHPEYDAGIHLTLTSEWKYFRWDGIMPSDHISSLIDTNGYFHSSVAEVGLHADPAEAEQELTAQIEKAVSAGIKISHLDTHMGSVMAKPGLMMVYLSLSEKYNLPVLFPREYLGILPEATAAKWKDKIFLLDNLFMLDERMAGEGWMESYRKGVESLKPGLNEIIVHLAINDDEMKAVSVDHDDYGSEWRNKDLDLVNSSEFRELLKKNNVIPVSWRQIKEAMNKEVKGNPKP